MLKLKKSCQKDRCIEKQPPHKIWDAKQIGVLRSNDIPAGVRRTDVFWKHSCVLAEYAPINHNEIKAYSKPYQSQDLRYSIQRHDILEEV